MIPKRIHQIWVGPNPIPAKSLAFIQHIKELHPDYEYRIWTDKDITPDNFTNYEYILATNIYAQKADIMRYEILYRHGGIYLDIDMQVLKPLDALLTNNLIVCNEDSNISKYMTNAFIASCPLNSNLGNCVLHIRDQAALLNNSSTVSQVTGPWFFRKCITLDDTVNVLPTHVIYPTHFLQKGYVPREFHPDTYTMHHWDKNW